MTDAGEGEMERHKSHIEFIVDFLRGEESDDRYLSELDTGILAAPLNDWADPPAYVHNGDARAELMGGRSRPSTPFGRSSTFELLLAYLRSQGVTDPRAEAADKRVQADYNALVQAQPSWLSIDNHPLGAEVLSSTAGLPAEQRTDAIRRAIEERFRSLDQTPRWIQSPEWPIVDGRPLIFVGALDISKIRHDVTDLYVFIDDTGRTVTVEQSM
ncbi:hypothetical protein [Herbiconiux liukaitaii]|uniref:hypothetical protein n=1 Tax=Herbiconiux liukaitaii TaxID=3342799 RepID=UPI0035B8D42C